MNTKSKLLQKLNCFFRHDRGAALAELAILVPILVLLVAAVSEFGRFFQQYTTIAKSTRTAARYLSNHPFPDNQDKARSLAVCGKLSCAGENPLVPGLSTANICIESTGSPKIETVTVRLPRNADDGCATPFAFQPIFNIGALLGTGLSFAPDISPSVTMYYMLD
jgi:Flp pilus assembly protein TadG